MKKKIIVLGIVVLVIAVAATIVGIIIKRNKVDYNIPLIDDQNNEDEEIDDYDDLDDEEDVFYEEEYEDIDYSKIDRKYTGKLKEAQNLYNKVSLNNTLEDIIAALGQPDEIDKEEDSEFVDVSYNAPSGEYVVSFSLEDNSVYEKNLYLLTSIDTGVFLSTELGTEIEDISKLSENIQENMTLDDVIKILGDKYYEVREDYDYGKWFSWCDKQENEISICFDEGVVTDIV